VPLRKPTASELALLRALLAPAFAGRDALVAQLATLRVQDLDGEGSLELQSSGPPSPEADGTPVDAVAPDGDGGELHAYLHVADGRLAELEVVQDAAEAMARLPAADQWKVSALG